MRMNVSYELCQRLEAILSMIGKMSILKKCAPISEKKEEFCKLRDFLSSVKEDSHSRYWFMNEIECFEHWILLYEIKEELKEKNRRLPKSIETLFDEIYDHLWEDSAILLRHLKYGEEDDYY